MRFPLALASLLIATAAPLNAAPIVNPSNISVGNTVICDTAEQAARFVSLRSGGNDTGQALQVVNKQTDKGACGAAIVAFHTGEAKDSGRLDGKPVQVVKITVIAYNKGTQWQFVPDTTQYAVLIPDGIEV